MLLPFLVFFPMIAAPLCRLLSKRSSVGQIVLWTVAAGLTFGACVYLFVTYPGMPFDFSWEGFCSLGLHLEMDGFRSVYVCVASFMWLMTTLFAPRYFHHDHHFPRYIFFNLLTLGATLGVFLSSDLYTTLIFFEIMSFTSYTWVVQEETPAAMRAGQTYLAVAVIGGLTTLMGLFLLYRELGTLSFSGMQTALRAGDGREGIITCAAWLTLFGFAAKAGLFPIHIWLPKAHPVAPAPASALLSGILTKSGVFGMIVVSTRLMEGNRLFGNELLVLGAITMLLGALLALFSVDLKRTLASSSVSQIGFITVGLATTVLLGEEGSLAAYGTLLHMVNHSLIKLCLFMCAGVVFMNLEELDLNRIRGFGRKKPIFHVCFLIGAVAIGCIPPLGSGFNSKSLIHEGLLEWIEVAKEEGLAWVPYKIVELLFLFSGGLTIAYMTKLYICLFHEKNEDEERQEAFDGMKHYMDLGGIIALLCSSLLLLPLGLLGSRLMTPLAERAMPFFSREVLSHEIHYFSGENLLGALESMAIGAIVYLFPVRRLLMQKTADGRSAYVNRWPAWLDLEDRVYRPFGAFLTEVLYRITSFVATIPDSRPVRVWIPALFTHVTAFLAHLPESAAVLRWIPNTVTLITRFLSQIPEYLVLFFRRTLFAARTLAAPPPVGNRLTYACGSALNHIARFLNRTVRRKKPIRTDFEYVFDASHEEAAREAGQILHSVSFGLLLLAMGLVGVILILIMHR
ncbi:MAG: NADH dehydrogenase [Clostridia bacterium]|nr:NADH dehydrogenase [Clostridia bacterium]